MDQNRNGLLDFYELTSGLSTLLKGSRDEQFNCEEEIYDDR
jgi:hypothetical protein